MKLTARFSKLLYTLAFCATTGLINPNVIGQTPSPGVIMTKEQIIDAGEKMADAQLAQLASKKSDIDWISGVMWAGYADFSHISSRNTYTNEIERLGDSVQWAPKGPRNADNFCICQTFLDAYETKRDPVRLAATQERLDAASNALLIEKNNFPTQWYWCDALFMAPVGHARLTAITKNPKYLDAMDKEWWKAAELLYDKDEHLFFRDKNFIGKPTKNGKKIFWSRGNGWVFGGLARLLPYIPQNYPSRARYVAVFKDMAAKLASLQQQDGTWRPSLLDPDEFPDSETSGTSLDCFAYAWGINNGLLDRATYLPIATKAWAALLAARRPDGLLGYVQGVATSPNKVVKKDGTQFYATGTFLMCACELSKLAPIVVPPKPQLTAKP